ncbi:hypothetical protein FIBSPDRAFT_455967 [Athelia psychrophila]|uniref:Uncharacterized protein n=1 Tax=Athelia psychrophila TaxID=1759441 RepID=A0A166LXF3_9AGAM|nr:hypothetical protein FIBSPDRAFT_455967 [Fibularhizoctonia sp. CBS 109695]
MALQNYIALKGGRRQVSKEDRKLVLTRAVLLPRSRPVLHPPGHPPSQIDLLLHVLELTMAPSHRARVQRVGEHFFVAVMEGRDVGRELGFAPLNEDTRRVILVQLADCRSYVKTLHRMHIHMHSVTLVPGTALGTDRDVGACHPRSCRSSSIACRRSFPRC